MVGTLTENNYEFYINNNDMSGDKPGFTTYHDRPLHNGDLAINIETKKGFFWDEETQSWK